MVSDSGLCTERVGKDAGGKDEISGLVRGKELCDCKSTLNPVVLSPFKYSLTPFVSSIFIPFRLIKVFSSA